MTIEDVGAVVAILGLIWGAAGVAGHALGYARHEDNHDPLGYALAMFPGPFAYLVWRENQP